ncbi:hypothetical protein GCM10010124_29360 [Pilimelia terevasa]|uniref:Uncharacterized protein n=1 Tax=Pilimelia terevasa TaxID=53372 RepID=A0A8J3FKT6_9ACTN|nr:hypothetical protein [Pilimelia terevasa]GGK34828.1 hypothetical protein GCM10010124_29360 [Pilimelia terevasa]
MRRLRLVSVVLTGALAASVGVAPPAAALDLGLGMLLPVLAPMLPGQQGWVSAMWTTDGDVCDIRITASGGSVGVDYPTNTDTYTSLYINSALADGNLDYSAFRFDIPDNALLAQLLTVKVSWRQMKSNSFKRTDDLRTKVFTCAGTARSDTALVTIPVSLALGAGVTQKTTALSVARGTPGWIKIAYAGTRPGMNNFRVALTPPANLTVTYPNGAGSAGLNANSALLVGTEDFAAVYLDASKLNAGTYKVPVTATYSGGSLTGSLTLTVT